jgi:CheY-like chemotaxis protein/anti-sigma regulatory factor (Ser/Thr protein kinase)
MVTLKQIFLQTRLNIIIAPVLLALLLSYSAPTPALAQDAPDTVTLPVVAGNDIRFTALTGEEGLPSGNVYGIAQDKRGFLWFATGDGLSRHDGYSFRVYRFDRGNPNSLANNTVQAILLGQGGILWLGTSGGGLDRFDPVTETFTHYRHDPDDPNSLSGNNIPQHGLSEDRQGALWVGTVGGGLNRLDPATGTFTHYQHDPQDANSLSSNAIENVYQDAGNTNPTDGLDIIHRSGEHLLTLINDVLDLARVEAGKLELNPAPFHLPTFLREIIEIIRARAEAKDISLAYETLSPLPDIVLADEKRLRQVLLNLLGNAIKFTDQGHVTLRVTAQDEGAPEIYPSHEAFILLHFEVEDTGIGISSDQIEHIFQPFEQVSEADRRAEGTGLGLAISQQIMQLMGRRLQVKSEPGHGSTFWFDVALPVTEIVEQKQFPAAREIIGYEGARRRVLVVDDKEYNRLLLTDMLTPLGFEVHTAEDGQQAVEKAHALQPDVILMDLVMPVKTGFEAARELRQQPAFEKILIVAVSASVLEIDAEKSQVAGCDAFLPKPVNMNNLFELLETRLKLAWIYAKPEGSAAGAAPLLPPPSETLAALHELARMGEILEIQQQALQLEEMDAAYGPFARKLQKLAKAFEIDQIKVFIKQFIEEKQDEDG